MLVRALCNTQGAYLHTDVRVAVALTGGVAGTKLDGVTTFLGRLNAMMIQQVSMNRPLFTRARIWLMLGDTAQRCPDPLFCFSGGAPVQSFALQVCPDVALREVFQCGPDMMMNSAIKALETLGLSTAVIHQESFNF